VPQRRQKCAFAETARLQFRHGLTPTGPAATCVGTGRRYGCCAAARIGVGCGDGTGAIAGPDGTPDAVGDSKEIWG
jgi:hypothetical protein